MSNVTISVVGNQIFFEIIKELKLFSKFKFKFYDNLDLWVKNTNQLEQLTIVFGNIKYKQYYEKINKENVPIILINKSSNFKNKTQNKFLEHISIPFRALDLEKKVIFLLSKYEFNKYSLINLSGYIIDRNERKIKKNELELQLTEKEIDFLISFSKSSKPLSKNYVLKNVWKYSDESDSHTVETHIYRLRKKILEKFKDNNFIKNNEKGYYI